MRIHGTNTLMLLLLLVPPVLTQDGFVWGRGAMDLKNMVLGWMEAIEDLLTEG